TDVANNERPAVDGKDTGSGVAQSISTPAGAQPQQAMPAAPTSAPNGTQLAFHAGWTMAALYAAAPLPAAASPRTEQPAAANPAPELPTVHQLSEPERRAVELGRLNRLLDCLSAHPGPSAVLGSLALPGSPAVPGPAALTATAAGMDATAP